MAHDVDVSLSQQQPVGGECRRRILVYCASSRFVDEHYFCAARGLGEALANAGREVIYGGGGAGLMGAVADAALASGGKVTGVIPRFMVEVEWGHENLSRQVIVETMHERKERMLALADAVVALPGGCGTFEELLEAITWKRLGLFFGPVVIANINDFYAPLVSLLENAIEERFMNEKHREMWTTVGSVREVVNALDAAPAWDRAARRYAAREG